jgi:hypothetical protein
MIITITIIETTTITATDIPTPTPQPPSSSWMYVWGLAFSALAPRPIVVYRAYHHDHHIYNNHTGLITVQVSSLEITKQQGKDNTWCIRLLFINPFLHLHKLSSCNKCRPYDTVLSVVSDVAGKLKTESQSNACIKPEGNTESWRTWTGKLSFISC